VSSASDDRIVDPQEELEPDAHDRVHVLEKEEREEDHAEADFEEESPLEAASHYEELIGLVGAVLRGDEVELDGHDGMSADERIALEVLQEVVRGKDATEEQIVYAEERLEMLNHALVVLQPTLAMALTPELASLRDQYDAVVEEVVALRDALEKLDDAQGEIFEQDREAAAETPDTDDAPDDEAAPEEPDKPDKPDKPARKPSDYMKRHKPAAAPKQPPAPPRDPDDDSPRPSTLHGEPGEPAVERPASRSTLFDEEP